MKYAFIIQGEGRGHQTQAIALAEMLIKNGHEVCLGLVGTSNPSELPTLLKRNVPFKIAPFLSPALCYSKKSNGLSLSITVKNAIPNIPAYFRSIKQIDKEIQKYQPDAIINFYDFLGGIYNLFFNKSIPIYCIGHQYLLLNKEFIHPKGFGFDRFVVNLNTKITALRATKKLALSFSDFPDEPSKNIYTVPPLLRHEIKLLEPLEKDYLLVYLTQAKLLKTLETYCRAHPKINIECFLQQAPPQETLPENLKVNGISNHVFLEKMALSRGIISTAGFESVCEAMYLAKPVMMIPIPNHYEQLCNGLDAQRAKAGIMQKTLNIDVFLEFLETNQYQTINHKFWINRAESMFLKALDVNSVVKEMAYESIS